MKAGMDPRDAQDPRWQGATPEETTEKLAGLQALIDNCEMSDVHIRVAALIPLCAS